MTPALAALDAFHFLRPLWLLALLGVAAVWMWSRRPLARNDELKASIAPHLRAALTVGGQGKRKFSPVDLIALSAALAFFGAAGPSWTRVPNPLISDSAPLVIALKVTESMTDPDVPPNRLGRAQQKISDLVTLRAGARTGLVAYAGSAHTAAPLTEDPAVLKPFTDGLAPEVMPKNGEDAGAALALAKEMLAREDSPGAILFVLDTLDPADATALSNQISTDPTIQILLLVMSRDAASAKELQDRSGATAVLVSADDADVASLNRQIEAAYRASLAADDRLEWDDRGWMVAWPLALLSLVWFRRGWTLRMAIASSVLVLAQTPGALRADGIADWFLTPDQQGWIAYQRKEYDRAAETFSDPMWRGQALYRDGDYETAAEVFGRIETPEAAFSQGMAAIKNRQYRPAIEAFETALERRPDWPEAEHNLELSKYILTYIEESREQSDTGEETGIGADDVVFDNEENRGAETEQSYAEDVQPETAEQWMRTVDTQTSDFLKQRFAQEAQGGGS